MNARILIPAALALIVALAAGIAIQGRKPQAASVPGMDSLRRPDRPIPLDNPVTMDMNGVSKPLRDRLNGPAVVFFWATWCPPCVREMPQLAKFRPRAEAAGLQVLTVAADAGGEAVVRKFLEERDMADLPVILDPDSSVSGRLKVRGMPTALLVDAQGREAARLEGAADWSRPEAIQMAVRATGMRSDFVVTR